MYNKFIVVFYSDHGAQQISADFAFLRTWIANNETLKEESRRYLLLLDSIRQCEGVAKILQSKAGSELDIKPAKNKVVPIGGNDNSEFYILNYIKSQSRALVRNPRTMTFLDNFNL